MNEIEEYLLMIFLENMGYLCLYNKLVKNNKMNVLEYDLLNDAANKWNNFKQEELGRTIPEEFYYLVSDSQLARIKIGKPFMAGIDISLNKENLKNKIKITVVEE